MDGTDREVLAQKDGGARGQDWIGAVNEGALPPAVAAVYNRRRSKAPSSNREGAFLFIGCQPSA
jgi:hypothetical protein